LSYIGAHSEERGALMGRILPSYARERLKASFGYLTAGVAITAASALVLFRSGAAFRMLTMSPWAFLGLSLVGTMVPLMITMSIDYKKNSLVKHMSWATFQAAMGASICSIGFLGGPIIMQAALCTGCLLGAVSLVVANTPNRDFLWMQGGVSVGLGVVVAASIGSLFFPGSSLLYNLTLYGGLGLFGGLLLYDADRLVTEAVEKPPTAIYDPINASIAIYLDLINIFVRLAQIFAMNQNRKR